ncbi:MAG: tetratricopeptide repeat protein [Nannocystaceae bacterium]|nr:hypothetical protein [bacterium]
MLRTLAAAKPDDPFPTYGLAMELTKQGADDEAREAFAGLVARHPDYVPTYLMFGNLLAKLGQRDEARSIYDAGIEAAGRAGDDHARGELEGARAELAGDSGA